MREIGRRLGYFVGGVVLLNGAAAHAGKAPDYGFDWVTIGATGNRGALASEVPMAPHLAGMGAVDYRYRLTRTEVTHTQYFEFVEAYAPYVIDSHVESLRFHGGSAQFVGYDGNGVPQYQFNASHPNLASQMAWEYAARFVNWLANGKASEQSAFESGVYDISLIDQGPDSVAERAPDARFWIPSRDEWAKAVHYDPNRYGEGQEGYWLYPYTSDTAPIPGPPGSGAETNAGNQWGAPPNMPVGQYPDANAPWGLLDASGGAREWLDDASVLGSSVRRLVAGSALGQSQVNDRMDVWGLGPETSAIFGLRLASAIPGPGAIWLGALAVATGVTRRRRT